MQKRSMVKIISICLTALILCSLIAVPNLFNSVAQAVEITYHRGVNLAGAEFNSGVIPGVEEKNFTWNDEKSYEYFASKGLTLIRVPFRWERMQPVLYDALDTKYLNGLKRNVAWAQKHGAKIILDVHNYGRYHGKVIGVSPDVPISAFTDLWVRLSNEFKDELAVYAYDLMNEPHGMGSGENDWKVISQAAVTAIRNNGDNKLIMVEGTYWANAHGWESKNGPNSWITDPANNFLYSAHCYFDSDASGTYKKTYDEELVANPNLENIGVNRLMDFATWCEKNNVRGFIGEFGIPNDDIRWNKVLDNFMNVMDEYGMDGTYWAGGKWWGDYKLSVHPDNDYTIDKQQMSVLTKHLSGTITIEPFEYLDITITDGVNPIENYSTATKIKADVVVRANVENNGAVFILAAFDSNDELIKLAMDKSDNIDRQTPLSATIDNVSNVSYIKLMLWEALIQIRPLIEYKTFSD